MITAFLPCRLGSQRVPNKNIKAFAGIEGGLLKIKIDQLLRTRKIDNILVSTNDPRILEFASRYKDSRLILDERPDYLGSNVTTTDDLINYVPSIISSGHVLWTHVTSPFIDEDDYSKIITIYLDQLNLGYDSLMTVLKLQGFVWNKFEPLSYDRKNLKWPMTQNIEALYEVDSGIFLSSIENYRNFNDRIGQFPFFYEQKKGKSIDIDWPEDFAFAEKLWSIRKFK